MTRRQQLLQFAILGLLHESPLHGYELRKRLGVALGVVRALSYGTLYPALRELVADGLITEATAAPIGTSRRPRIVYELTESGAARFVELARRTDPESLDDDGFPLRMAFFGRTDAEVRLRLLEGRRLRLEQRLAQLREGAARHGAARDSWGTALQRHGEEATEREVRWLSDLIEAEHHPQPGTQ